MPGLSNSATSWEQSEIPVAIGTTLGMLCEAHINIVAQSGHLPGCGAVFPSPSGQHAMSPIVDMAEPAVASAADGATMGPMTRPAITNHAKIRRSSFTGLPFHG